MTTTIKATVKEGRLQIEAPPDWPDGTIVEIAALESPVDDKMSSEEIAATLAAIDRFEPVEMTEAELSSWEAERRQRIEREKANFFQHAETLRGNWE